jgi:excisionase family DNA binding protein
MHRHDLERITVNQSITTPSNSTPASWATVNEAAEILRVNPSTVRRWVAQNILTAARIGKTTLRIDLSSLRYETIGAAA